MDMVKIGKFLAELRKESGLTQEELGDELGVTNKTVSRWENGNYLPPVEMLGLLSEKYRLTINEIISGERLDGEDYKQKAEENITAALSKSVFTAKEKAKYFKKKWFKDHCFELIAEIILLVAAMALSAVFYDKIMPAVAIIAVVWSFFMTNRLNAYIESHLYGGVPKNDKSE